MQKRYPFKFLDAYTRDDSEFFFGRQEEIESLYEMVFQTDLLLVYGASGTGKTSLIQCGLASKFQSHDWLALTIRRGNNLNTSFEKALNDAGGDLESESTDLNWLNDDDAWETGSAPTAQSLSPLAKTLKAIYLKHFRPVYLIFDQFEELYILGDKSEQDQFIQTVKEILVVEQPVKTIIVIREEYLGYLYEFERQVPELLRKKLRVEPMNLDKVSSIIKGVGRLPQSNIQLKNGEENNIAIAIFDKIRGQEKILTIELPYLQVFLDKLYLQITKDENRVANAEFSLKALTQIGDIGDVLRNFLDEQVLKIARRLNQTSENIWRFLSPFVTLDGTKEPLTEAALRDRLTGLSEQTNQMLALGGLGPFASKADFIVQALRAFVNSRILRYTEAEGVYEVAHDSLAKQIQAKRSDEEIAILEVQRLVHSQVNMKDEAKEYFTEKQLLFIEPYLDKFKITTEEQNWIDKSRAEVKSEKEAEKRRHREELVNTRKRLQMVRSLLGVAVVAFLAALYFGFDSNKQKKFAETQRQTAIAEREKTQKALDEVYKEQGKRAKITFEDLKRRSANIMLAGGCPDDLLKEMLEIAAWHPDSNAMRLGLNELYSLNKNCK